MLSLLNHHFKHFQMLSILFFHFLRPWIIKTVDTKTTNKACYCLNVTKTSYKKLQVKLRRTKMGNGSMSPGCLACGLSQSHQGTSVIWQSCLLYRYAKSKTSKTCIINRYITNKIHLASILFTLFPTQLQFQHLIPDDIIKKLPKFVQKKYLYFITL